MLQLYCCCNIRVTLE